MQKYFEKIKEKCLSDKRIGRSSLEAFLEIVDEVAEECKEPELTVPQLLKPNPKMEEFLADVEAKSEYVESVVLAEKLRSEAERQEDLSELLRSAADRIEDLDDNVNDWVLAFDMLNDRENRHHYLEYWREKNGKSDLCYPNGDQIYKDFWELKKMVDGDGDLSGKTSNEE